MFVRTRAFGLAHFLSLFLCFSVAAQAQDKPSPIIDQIKDVTAKLQELQKRPDQIDPKLIESLSSLNAIVDQFTAPDIAPVAKAAGILAKELPRFDDAALGKKEVRDALDAARKAIEDTESNSELLRLDAQATRFSAALTAFKDQPKSPLAETLTTLKEAMSTKIAKTYGIHIVYARAGDLRFAGDRTRTCNAAGYFRQECNKNLSCKVGENVTLDQICGYEPAPFAEDRNRGVLVGFRCVLASEEEWQNLAASDWDFFDRKSFALFKNTGDSKGVHQVRLQGKAVFFCDQKRDPKPKTTGAPPGPAPK